MCKDKQFMEQNVQDDIHLYDVTFERLQSINKEFCLHFPVKYGVQSVYLLIIIVCVIFGCLFQQSVKHGLEGQHNLINIIFLSLSIIIEAYVFVWIIKFLGGVMTDCREARKQWDKKIMDVYGYLLENVTAIQKVKVELEIKRLKGELTEEETKQIEKLVKAGIEDTVNKSIDKKVKQYIEEQKIEAIKSHVDVVYAVRIKDDKCGGQETI